MKLLITGAGGQVGYELSRKSEAHGFETISLNRLVLDITDNAQIESVMTSLRPWLVINAAACTQVDLAETETERAFAVNRDGPLCLARACTKARIPLIHFSTDFVFDGRQQTPYLETDRIGPLSVYGKSKAQGEAAVRASLAEYLIIRTSWVYGVHGNNFVKTMLRLGRERDELRVVADQYGSPTSAADLADAVLTLAAHIRDRAPVPWGTYHYCGQGITTWHGFAEEILTLARQHLPIRTRHVRPIPTAGYPTAATRPAFSALDCGKIRETFGIVTKPWQESLKNVVSRILSEKA